MSDYLINVDRNKMNPDKKAFLDRFDEIIANNRSDDSRNLCKQISYLGVDDLFKCFTI